MIFAGPLSFRLYDLEAGLNKDEFMKSKLVLGLLLLINVIRQMMLSSAAAKSHQEAANHYNKCVMATETQSLPPVFSLKLQTAIRASPNEFATALSDEMSRPLWDPNLRSLVKKVKTSRKVELLYEGNPIQY